MSIRRAVFDVVEFKADVDGPGTFEALVAVYGNVDRQNDRIVKGYFDGSIARWQEKGDPLPAIWSHNWGDPHAYFGEIDPAQLRSTDAGLVVRGKADLDDPTAVKIHKLLKTRRVTQWSFAHEVIREKTTEDGVNELLEGDLIETGPTLRGANPLTGTLEAKSDGTTVVQVPVPGDEPLELTVYRAAETKGGFHEKGGRGAATDESDWDANAAMTSATSAADYRAICAGERSEGEPGERGHWALPHHKAPGRPANAAGVRAARARFAQTEGLANREAARRHLFEVHTLPSDEASTDPDTVKAADVVDALRQIRDGTTKLLARLDGATEPEPEKGPDPDLATRLEQARMDLES